jgi:PHD/YefM family antitoxin component YafN of YafNO toxin-antitoxin module
MNGEGEKINAMKHIENARQHLASHSQLGRIRRFKSGGATAMNIASELAAAIEQLAEGQKQLAESHKQSEKKYLIYLERFEKIEVQTQVLDNATARLEIVTAGDEQLIDDLGAALEELQLDLLRLTRLQELLNEQLKQQSS